VRPWSDAQVVGVNVEGSDQVADAVAAVVGRPVPLGTTLPRPTSAMLGAQALGALLVEADHDAVFGLLPVQSQDPRRLRLVVAIRALLPAASALQRDAVAGKNPAKLGGRDGQSLPAQVPRELGQAPTRARHPEPVGTSAGDRDDRLLVVSRDPAGTPPENEGATSPTRDG
jgi:hypothetical protein